MDDSRSSSPTACSRRAGQLILAMLLGFSLIGCGSKTPFELTHIKGKVVCSDGSLIQADQILVQFVPQGIQNQGMNAPRAAETYADVSDGTFSDLTTWKFADGVMVGRHKVVVISLKIGSHGMGVPTTAIPARYHQASTTPLEVEVTSDGDNIFSLEIEVGS